MENTSIGKFNVIGHVGRGAMADVYKALHPELNRVVAIKVLSRALVHSPEMRARFRREARAIAALRHPNIVQVFDFDIVDDAYYMVMEFIEGKALNHHLADLRRRDARMPLQEVLRVVTGVGRALDYAHEQGMLHRDVKPGNIMFRGDGGIVLTDFGVAKILNASNDITATSSLAGTPAYMAPEQWTDDEPDHRSDIYSLGIVLFELTTSQLPFNDQTPGRLMFKHISEPPPLPRKLNRKIPADLESVVLHAMAKEPCDRYQTAQELVDDLQALRHQVERTAATGVFKHPPRPQISSKSAGNAPALAAVRPSRARWLGAGGVILLIALFFLLLRGFGGSAAVEATPNGTGTALAVRLAALESTLSITDTPAPTETHIPTDTPLPTRLPSRTPAPSATPSPTFPPPTQTPGFTKTATSSRMPSPSPTTCLPAVDLAEDVDFYNASWWNTVDASFEKTWRLLFDGACAWPDNIVLVHVDGQGFGLDEPYAVGASAADLPLELTVPLRAPSIPGEYEGQFQLQTLDGKSVGEPLKVVLEARPRGAPTPTGSDSVEAVHIEDSDLFDWSKDPAHDVWRGKVRLFATGGTGQYTWFRDTLDNPLPGDVLEFEWGICRDFFGSVWVVSGEARDHMGLHVPYPGTCE